MLLVHGLTTLTQVAWASTVCPAGPPKCNFATIQAALDAAEDGGTVTIMEPGTYSESGLSRARQGITLTSVDPGAKETFIIDGGGSGPVVQMGSFWLLQGVTITGGVAADGGGVTLGGPAIIRNCIIHGNVATAGGGGISVNAGSGDLTVEDSEIHGNSARFGAGISTVADLTLTGSEVYDNEAARAGGLAAFAGGLNVWGDLIIEDSEIYDNRVTGTGGLAGGILKNTPGSFVSLENTDIYNNSVSSGSGGGFRINTGFVTVTGGSIDGNTASSTGGGVHLVGGTTAFVDVDVTGNSAPVDGGGIHCGAGILESFSGVLGNNTVNDLGGSCASPQCTPGDIESCPIDLPGVCALGRRACSAAALWGPCFVDKTPQPKERVCGDGLDDDCDGKSDGEDEDCTSVLPATAAEVPESGTDGDPVNTLTGELFQDFDPDLDLGGPLPVIFARYYASGLLALGISGRLGDNWRHNYEWSLVDNTGTTGFVEITSPRGRRVDFELESGDFELRGLPDVRFQLVEDLGGFTLGDPRTSLLYEFDASGKLISISDGSLNSLTLSYTGAELASVSDGLGRSLSFTHTSGDLTEVTDGTRSLIFGYTGSHLTSFTDARGKTTTYAYDPGGLMTSWTRPRGNTPYSQTWDGSDRVATQTEAPSHTYTYAYDDVSRITTLTDPAANSSEHIHSLDGQLTDVESEDGESFDMVYNGAGDRIGLTDRLGDATTITTHEPSGKRASITHADGTTTSYDHAARRIGGITFYDLRRIDFPDGTSEGFLWSVSGNLISRVDRAGHTWSFIYDERGQLLSVINPLGGETTRVYNADGTLASETDPSGNTTTYGYDSLLRLNLITYADTNTRSFTYDNNDNLLTVTDERSNTTTFTYDDNGNLATITDPLTNTVTFGYDDVDRLASVTDALSNPATLTYDALGRVETSTDRAGDTIAFDYDARGRLTSVTDGAGKIWPRGWDLESVPSSESDPLDNTTTLSSDQMGRVTQVGSPLGHDTIRSYDSLGRVTRIIDPAGEVSDLSYEPRGLLSDIVRGGLSTQVAYDELGRITSITDPNGQDWLLGWDEHGRLSSRTDPLAQQIDFTYDNRNRVDLATYPGGLGTLTPTYDGVGNVTRRLYSDGTDLNYTYDDADRLTTAEGLALAYDANDALVESNGLTMTRDLSGRIETLTLAPGKTVTYSYNSRGLLSQVTDWVAGAAGITTFTYDDASRLTRIDRPNGVDTTYTWDADSRLTGVTEVGTASSTLTYDPAGKLIRADRNVPTAGTAGGVTPFNLAYDGASQVSTFTYDALGRLTDDGTRTYAWDLASRLTSVTVPPDTVSYTYDALGNRITRTEAGSTRGYVWNYALALPSVNVERQGGVAGADLRYYLTTPGGLLLYSREAADDSRRDYHLDDVGNVLFLTNGVGAVVRSYAYDPYGQVLAEAGAGENLFTWQGGLGVMTEAGATGASDGLYYLRARYYDGSTRRFLSRDPVSTLDPATVNPYQYAAGRPTGLVDPLGLDPLSQSTLDPLDPEPLELGGLSDSVVGDLQEFSLEELIVVCGVETRRNAVAQKAALKQALKQAKASLAAIQSNVDRLRGSLQSNRAAEQENERVKEVLPVQALVTLGQFPFREEESEWLESLELDLIDAQERLTRSEAAVECLEDALTGLAGATGDLQRVVVL